MVDSVSSASHGFSLKRRLVVGLGATVCAFWLAAVALSGVILRHELDEVLDSALQEVVQRVLPLAYSEILARDTDDAVQKRLPDVGKHDEYITYVVRDGQGRILVQSHDADPARFPTDLTTGFRDWSGARYYTESAVSGSIVVSAMERPGHRWTTLLQTLLALAIPLVVLLPAVIGTVVWLVANSIRPVAALGEAIALRGETDLTPIEQTRLPTEIQPIGQSVNALLLRLRRAITAERTFTANAAHELRTPIAGALAHTQRLIADLRDGDAQSRARDIETSLRRMARLTEKLLQLAKAEGGSLRGDSEHDLRDVFPLVLFETGAADRVSLNLPLEAVRSNVDIDIFAIALRNLVENALKHGHPTEPIRIMMRADGRLSVANAGAPIAPETFDNLCQRFTRGHVLTEGAGLGLAIVAAIANGLGGALTLVTPEETGAERVQMNLSFPLR